MCGIVAILLDDDQQNIQLLRSSLSTIEHRGAPTFRYELGEDPSQTIVMGTHRLPIVGQANGKQPKTSPRGHIQIVFNGEIYNASQLFHKLSFANDNFHPYENDTEILAAALEYWGIERTIKKLDWEGAFIAYNRQQRAIIAARDHLGIKPLYYCQFDDGALAIASEIKALLVLPKVTQVEMVKPGTYLRIEVERTPFAIEEQCYWQLPSQRTNSDNLTLLEERLRNLLRASVHARVPDFPYAVTLSGGIDSSIILKYAVEKSKNVTAYTLATAHSPDLPYAQQLCKELGVRHVLVEAEDEKILLENLPETVRELETWEWHIITHAAPMRAITQRIAADGHKVVLTGEGADELFGGYYRSQIPPVPQSFAREYFQRINELHRTNCQRLDRIGMVSTLELRVPFLSKDLVQFASQLPVELLWRDGVSKWILRDALSNELHHSIIKRPKLSFATGAGYQYGPHAEGRALLGEQIREYYSSLKINTSWNYLARFPAERVFLHFFSIYGYERATFLCSRTL